MMRRFVTLALLLASSPALAQLQFDSRSGQSEVQAAIPGLVWLQNKPASLFDLGMMELSNAANKSAQALFDVTGAVAEYQPDKGLVLLSFYASTPYSEENCAFVARKLRETMFPKRDAPQQLGADLSSYFTTYGAANPDRPTTIGDELVKVLRFAVFMPGGACRVPLYGSDEMFFWKDPNAPLPQLPAAPGLPATPLTMPSTPVPAPAPAATPAPAPRAR